MVGGLFFGLKAAVLAVVLEAVVRIGRRALKNNVMVTLAAVAFVAIFFFDGPFPIIIFVAALTGFVGARAGAPQFLAGGGHGASGKVDTGPYLLGDDLPPHARPTVASSLRISAVWLVLWLIPIAAVLALVGPHDVFAHIAVFFSKMAMVTFGGAYAVLVD